MESKNLGRKFGKELAQPLRDETARKLQEARKMPKSHGELNKIKKEDRPEYGSYIEGTIEKVEENILGRIFRTYEFKHSLYKLDEILGRAKHTRVERVRDYYQNQLDKILHESPLSEEEMETYLSEESMIAMSLEDYLVLLKRLSGNFVTHVTRQGVREQGSFHNAGMGDFFDSFTKILEGKKLQSFLANFMTDPNSIPYLVSNIRRVKEHTGLSGEALVEKALEITNLSHDENMPADQGSVHVAVNTVASYYYGAENGYNFYFYFPAEFIAYNYFHHHKSATQSNMAERQQGLSGSSYDQDWTDKHNDLAIWNKGGGVPINAGITCIPKDVKVDKQTGSQYKLVDGKPIKKADGFGYELAEDTTTSQEFWENYFDVNPNLRPSKLIYGHFETMPKFTTTKFYESLFKQKVFATAEDLSEFKKIDEKVFTEYKAGLADLIRKLEKEGRI